jgi:hypothetical protein
MVNFVLSHIKQLANQDMRLRCIVFIILSSIVLVPLNAQKIYSVISGELIFSFSDPQFSNTFKAQYKNAEITKTDMRFTCFFHLGEYWHLDFTNNLGIFTGIGIRNIGLISDEKLPEIVGFNQTVDYKIIRRLYTLGVPIAFKLGSFKDHSYFYLGGEYETGLQYKQKYWSNTQTRSGVKTKSSQWFGDQTPHFLPSVFAGIQMQRGINIKFRYYLVNFLNSDYKAGNNDTPGTNFNISDLTRYSKSEVFYISLCWQFRTYRLIPAKPQTRTQVALN